MFGINAGFCVYAKVQMMQTTLIQLILVEPNKTYLFRGRNLLGMISCVCERLIERLTDARNPFTTDNILVWS